MVELAVVAVLVMEELVIIGLVVALVTGLVVVVVEVVVVEVVVGTGFQSLQVSQEQMDQMRVWRLTRMFSSWLYNVRTHLPWSEIYPGIALIGRAPTLLRSHWSRAS